MKQIMPSWSIVVIAIFWGVLVQCTGTPFLLLPTGKFGVGTTSFHIIDTNRGEHGTKERSNGKFRELMMQLWYPASPGAQGKKLIYMADILRYFKDMAHDYTKIPQEKLAYLDSLMTHAILDVPCDQTVKKYPLVLFSQGWGASRYAYTSLVEDLASHGYIVMAVDHPYESLATAFPDGRVIPYSFVTNQTDEEDDRMMNKQLHVRLADMECAMHYLRHINECDQKKIIACAIDFDRIGVIGHSFGAAVATLLPSCKAVINLDGWLSQEHIDTAELNKPYMMIIAQDSCDTFDEEVAHLESGMRHVLQRENALCVTSKTIEQNFYNTLLHNAYYVLFKKALHSSFSDFNVIVPSPPNDKEINPTRGLAIIRELLRDFMDKYLKEQVAVTIDSKLNNYPELVIQSKS